MKVYELYEEGSDDRIGVFNTREKAIAAAREDFESMLNDCDDMDATPDDFEPYYDIVEVMVD